MMDYEAPRDYGSRDPFVHREHMVKVPIVASEVVKLSEKVMFPTEEYPRYNFIGKILGQKGSTLKGLQRSTKCKMSILGRGSTRDKKSEEELSKSDDAQHEHLKESLHVLIQVEAPQIEAHRRLSAALREVYRFMVPGDDMMPDQVDARQPYHNEPEGGRPGGSRDDARVPLIRYGTPPPGALILSEQPPRDGGRPQRGGRRGPPPNVYDYEAPVNEGYSENRGGYNRGGYNRGGSRVGEKRSAPSNGYPLKRYGDSY